MRENINVCLCVTKMYVSENVRRVYRLHMYGCNIYYVCNIVTTLLATTS